MAQVIFKKGTSKQLEAAPLQDGTLAVTTDDGRMHIDYKDKNGEMKRKTLYAGKLKIGDQVFDGTQDVEIGVFDGACWEEI